MTRTLQLLNLTAGIEEPLSLHWEQFSTSPGMICKHCSLCF